LCNSAFGTQTKFLFAALLVLGYALLGAAQAQGALYWGTLATISRANLDGSNPQAEFIKTRGSSICSIAVTATSIYWTDPYGDSIGRADLDGGNVDSDFISPAGGLPCGLAVDSSYVYWANLEGNTIGRARLDDTGVDTSFISTVERPGGVAVDMASIYWSSDHEGIWRTDLNGVHSPEEVVDDLEHPWGVALQSGSLFWTGRQAGAIGRASLDGSGAVPNLIEGAHWPVSLGIQDGYLYWVNADWDFESIERARLDGSDRSQIPLGPLWHPYALAVDGRWLDPYAPSPSIVKQKSRLRIGKPRQSPRTRSISFPVDLGGQGWLEAEADGAGVRVLPEGVENRGFFEAGRKWLRIAPRRGAGSGSRCVLRILRRGGAVKLWLGVKFFEKGREPVEQKRRFLLFGRGHGNEQVRPVSCRSRAG
jgi:hypothetical protein